MIYESATIQVNHTMLNTKTYLWHRRLGHISSVALRCTQAINIPARHLLSESKTVAIPH